MPTKIETSLWREIEVVARVVGGLGQPRRDREPRIGRAGLSGEQVGADRTFRVQANEPSGRKTWWTMLGAVAVPWSGRGPRACPEANSGSDRRLGPADRSPNRQPGPDGGRAGAAALTTPARITAAAAIAVADRRKVRIRRMDGLLSGRWIGHDGSVRAAKIWLECQARPGVRRRMSSTDAASTTHAGPRPPPRRSSVGSARAGPRVRALRPHRGPATRPARGRPHWSAVGSAGSGRSVGRLTPAFGSSLHPLAHDDATVMPTRRCGPGRSRAGR